MSSADIDAATAPNPLTFAAWLRDRGDAVVNDDPAAAETLYLAAEQVPAILSAPAWGPLPTAAEVTAHVARSAPARASDGAPWARRDADGVGIVYVRVVDGEVEARNGGSLRWWSVGGFNGVDVRWRPVDADGVAVERGER